MKYVLNASNCIIFICDRKWLCSNQTGCCLTNIGSARLINPIISIPNYLHKFITKIYLLIGRSYISCILIDLKLVNSI